MNEFELELANGYVLMSELNLKICNEFVHIEYENKGDLNCELMKESISEQY